MGFQLRLKDEIDDKITEIAKREQRSKNKEIEYILEKYIKEYEQKNKEVKIKEN